MRVNWINYEVRHDEHWRWGHVTWISCGNHVHVGKGKEIIGQAAPGVLKDTKRLPTFLGAVLAHLRTKWDQTKVVGYPNSRGIVWPHSISEKPAEKGMRDQRIEGRRRYCKNRRFQANFAHNSLIQRWIMANQCCRWGFLATPNALAQSVSSKSIPFSIVCRFFFSQCVFECGLLSPTLPLT